MGETTRLVQACRSCTAPVVWGETEARHRTIPIDSTPDPAGTLLLLDRDGDRPLVRYVDPMDRHKHAGRLYRSHFATCPNAATHRRRS